MTPRFTARAARVGGCAALAISLAAAIAFASPLPTAPLSHLVLRAGDLPHGLVQFTSQTDTAATLLKNEGMGGSQLRAAGFVAGYSSSFLSAQLFASKGKTPNGLLLAASLVGQFRQATGAQKIFTMLSRMAPKNTHAFRTMVIRSIGNQSAGFTTTQPVKGGYRLTADIVVLRRGRYVAVIEGAGKAMTLGKEDIAVTGLAKVVDSRIAANG